MNAAELIAARRTAEQAISDMPDGPLRVKAFEVILNSLLSRSGQLIPEKTARVSENAPVRQASSLGARVALLRDEGFFREPRSLADIQEKLREKGWHYAQTNLSTPLLRLVRQRQLRRLQSSDGTKHVWRYSVP